jgi:hypothetical protein
MRRMNLGRRASTLSFVVVLAAVALALTSVGGVAAAENIVVVPKNGDGGGQKEQREVDARRQQHIDHLFAKAGERKRRERGETGDGDGDKRRHGGRLPRKLFPHVDGAGKDDEALNNEQQQQQRRARPDEADEARRRGGGGRGMEGGEDRREEAERSVREHAGPDVSALLQQQGGASSSPDEAQRDGESGDRGESAQCLHGYASATALGTCVCSHGWGGKHCEVDKIPSCNRDETYTCHNVVTGRVLAHPSCACYSECRMLLKATYGEADYQNLLKERRADHSGCTKGGVEGGTVIDPEAENEVTLGTVVVGLYKLNPVDPYES